MKLWKRNAVVAAIVLFVCVAVYLNWSYQKETMDTGKALGQAELVGAATNDPMLLTSPQPSGAPAESGTPAPTGASTGYFASARLNREQARASALAVLRETSDSESAQADARAEADAAIETLAAATVSEAQIENLVIAKGYADCIAFISDSGASVVVSATEDGLQEADVAKITEIVTGETGISAAQITIIEAQS